MQRQEPSRKLARPDHGREDDLAAVVDPASRNRHFLENLGCHDGSNMTEEHDIWKKAALRWGNKMQGVGDWFV